jgi:hypothetical protein
MHGGKTPVVRGLGDRWGMVSLRLEHFTFRKSTATGYWLDDRGVGVPVPICIKNYPFSTSFRQILGPSIISPIQWVLTASPRGLKWPVREADHS